VGTFSFYGNCSNAVINGNTNIGTIKGRNFSYTGGIVGKIHSKCEFRSCLNAGIIEGSLHCVGGIAGFVNDSTKITQCLNTNKVDSTSTDFYGAIVGKNHGTIEECFYDNQTSFVGDSDTNAVGLPTKDMLYDKLNSYLSDSV